MLSDKEAMMLWRRLFRGQAITRLTLNEATSLLEKLSPESSLRNRLATELAELKQLHFEN